MSHTLFTQICSTPSVSSPYEETKRKILSDMQSDGAAGRDSYHRIIRVCSCIDLWPVTYKIEVQVQCWLTSTETLRTIREREPRTATSTFTQLLSSVNMEGLCSWLKYFRESAFLWPWIKHIREASGPDLKTSERSSLKHFRELTDNYSFRVATGSS